MYELGTRYRLPHEWDRPSLGWRVARLIGYAAGWAIAAAVMAMVIFSFLAEDIP